MDHNWNTKIDKISHVYVPKTYTKVNGNSDVIDLFEIYK